MCSVTRLERLRVATIMGARYFSAAEGLGFAALGFGIMRFLFDGGAKNTCRGVITQDFSSHFQASLGSDGSVLTSPSALVHHGLQQLTLGARFIHDTWVFV